MLVKKITLGGLTEAIPEIIDKVSRGGILLQELSGADSIINLAREEIFLDPDHTL